MNKLIFLISIFSIINCSAQDLQFSILNDIVSFDGHTHIDFSYSAIINNGPDSLNVDIVRYYQEVHPGWISAMTIDQFFYVPLDDSIRVLIRPYSQIEFRSGFKILDWTTSQIAEVSYLIQNVEEPDNHFYYTTYAVNTSGLSTNLTNSIIDKYIIVYPNPTLNQININTDLKILESEILDYNGNVLYKCGNIDKINVNQLSKGIYFIKIKTNSGVVVKKILKN